MELKNLARALCAARKDYKRIRKNAINPGARGAKYATLDSILAAIEYALDKHGITILGTPQLVAMNGTTTPALETVIIHNESGEFKQGFYPLPDGSNSHAMGSAITYGRRYTLCAMLNVVADADDDGNANTPSAISTRVDNAKGTPSLKSSAATGQPGTNRAGTAAKVTGDSGRYTTYARPNA